MASRTVAVHPGNEVKATMPASASPKRDHRFYTAMAFAITFGVFAGFTPTYYARSYFHGPAIPFWVELHGAVFTAWILLYLPAESPGDVRRNEAPSQSGLIRGDSLRRGLLFRVCHPLTPGQRRKVLPLSRCLQFARRPPSPRCFSLRSSSLSVSFSGAMARPTSA